jgi:hypothetical protein
MTPQLIASIASAVVSALLAFIVYRINRGQELRDGRVTSLESKVHAIELAIAGDLASKEDVTGLANREDVTTLTRRLDKLDELMQQVRDMVIRLDERGKHTTTE